MNWKRVNADMQNNESMETKKVRKIKWKDILMLQAVFLIYSIYSVVAKFASMKEKFSMEFILIFGVGVCILGVYALVWQQVIKRFELSIAYANKAITLVWAIVWGLLLFKEELTPGKIAGIILVMIGIFVLNGGQEEKA